MVGASGASPESVQLWVAQVNGARALARLDFPRRPRAAVDGNDILLHWSTLAATEPPPPRSLGHGQIPGFPCALRKMDKLRRLGRTKGARPR